MYSKAIITLSLLLSDFAHAEWDGKDGRVARSKCISDREAALLVSNFESLFVNVDPVIANGILTADFREYSDTLNWLEPPATANYTPGALTDGPRGKFIKDLYAEQAAGFNPPFATLGVYHDCHSVTFRWRLETQPIACSGIDVLILTTNSYLIKTDYSEFNVLPLLLVSAGCNLTCPSS